MANNSEIAHVFIKSLKNRLLKQNSNIIAAVVGPTGSGKSFYSLQLGKSIYPGFTIKNTYFEPSDLLRAINENQIKKGDIAVLEEAGASLGSRSAMSSQNKIFSVLLQTVRFLNFGLILNLPSLSFLDSSVRKLMHYRFIMAGINRKRKISYAKLYETSFDDFSGKTYHKAPVITYKGKTGRLFMLGMHMPDKDIIKQYEAKKTEYCAKLYKDSLDKLTKDKPVIKDDEEIIQTIKDNLDKFTKQHGDRKYISHALICGEFGIGKKKAQIIKTIIESSGCMPPRLSNISEQNPIVDAKQ